MISDYEHVLDPKHIVDYDDALGVDCDQAPADVAVFDIPFKCELQRVQAAVTEACAGATTKPAMKFDKRPTAGSDTGRGDGDMGELILGTTAAGKVVYDLVGRGQILLPGEEVVVQLTVQATGTGAAGHFRPALVVKPLAETLVNLSNMVETT